MYNPYSLSGKTILITGASSGIGRSTAIECAKLGATLILTARNEERLKETKNMLEGKERLHEYIVIDLTVEEECETMIHNLPLLDGFVCNAGISKMKPVQYYSLDEIEHTFKINCFAPMLMIKQLIKKKKLSKNSSIVFTASIAGFTNIVPSNGIYGASKCALSSYMKYVALELAGRGIRCNTVHPGLVETPMISNNSLTEEDKSRSIEQYPLKRYGKPEEIAFAIIYLLSDASSWVTGTNIVIDGGRSLK